MRQPFLSARYTSVVGSSSQGSRRRELTRISEQIATPLPPSHSDQSCFNEGGRGGLLSRDGPKGLPREVEERVFTGLDEPTTEV